VAAYWSAWPNFKANRKGRAFPADPTGQGKLAPSSCRIEGSAGLRPHAREYLFQISAGRYNTAARRAACQDLASRSV
jgi:hypothetical protein